MSRFRPSQRTLVTTAIILALVAWSALRAVELRRKDRLIEQLEAQLRAEANQTARWRSQAEGAIKGLQEQYGELLELRAAAAERSAGAKGDAVQP